MIFLHIGCDTNGAFFLYGLRFNRLGVGDSVEIAIEPIVNELVSKEL